nr:LysR family substrate-binding domain-containing protein [Tolumonas osonensis]
MPEAHKLRDYLERLEIKDEHEIKVRPLNPTYFDILMANCHDSGFTPRILHEARSVASQVGLVGCNQGIALVPLALQKMAPENVVIRPLKGNINVTTISVAWNSHRNHPAVASVIQWIEAHHLPAPG